MLGTTSTRIFRQAVRRARVSLPAIAAEMGISPVTLQQYLHLATPSARVAVKLRRWLLKYARELERLAKKLPAKETDT